MMTNNEPKYKIGGRYFFEKMNFSNLSIYESVYSFLKVKKAPNNTITLSFLINTKFVTYHIFVVGRSGNPYLSCNIIPVIKIINSV